MLNKEEIEDIKYDLRTFHKILWNEHREGTYTIQRTLEYINQLESREQKLIEKLEKKIRYYEENDEILATSNDNYSDGTVIKKFIDEFIEILSILKGENQVIVK